MTIRDDPLNRNWCDLDHDTHLQLFDGLRAATFCFLATDKDGNHKIAGTGFLIAVGLDTGLVVTAKHVLSEGVFGIQHPHPRFARSSLFIPPSALSPSLDPKRLHAAWMGAHSALVADVIHATYTETLDIALCIVIPQKEEEFDAAVSIPLDASVPIEGETVYIVSQAELQVDSEVIGEPKWSFEFSMYRRLAVRAAVVTGVHQDGYRQYKWPCFTTSAPVQAGMSGGFVFRQRADGGITACGVVCADNSTDEASNSNFIAGESVIGSTWPILGLSLPLKFDAEGAQGTMSVYDFVKEGLIIMDVNELGRISLSRDQDGGVQSIVRRP